mmetsp:Transcript_17985/g.23438  ORF Transcript_17985/g.23438 Transcript_17985/m.23438 type:complete len:260 (+) Transcript_17985:39-818(+)
MEKQGVKDLRLTVEFRHLQENAPGGVYVIPNKLRSWDGLIFVRRGMYASGVFKFRVELPPNYNDYNVWPKICFKTKVYSPMVNPETGEIDLKSAYPTWDPTKHYVVMALTFVKKIFYLKKGDVPQTPFHPVAAEAFESDPAEFLKKVSACVNASLSDDALYNDDDKDRMFTFRKDRINSRRVQGLARLLRIDNDEDSETPILYARRENPADLVINYLATTTLSDDEYGDDNDLSPSGNRRVLTNSRSAQPFSLPSNSPV